MNKVRVKRVLLALAALVVLAQVVQPKRTNPPIVASRSLEAHVQVPPQVETILRRACYDCHSSSTVWPWYSHIAPVSWLLADDVNGARSHFNFDDWEAQANPKDAAENLGLMCKEVRDGDMPPITYRFMHAASKLSPGDVTTLCSWSESFISPSGPAEKP